MKISNRDKGILLGLFGVILAVVSYVLIYNPTTLKTEELKTQVASLQSRVNKLTELENNMAHYQKQIEVNKEKSEKIVDRFPAEIKPENEIVYVIDLENRLDVQFSTLNYGTPVEIVTSNATAGVNAYCTALNLSYRSTYQGLKDVIIYTAEQEDRMVVESVTASFDATTGNLAGSMTINMYTLAGTERMYEKPYVPSMYIGVPNIFGTIEVPVNQGTN